MQQSTMAADNTMRLIIVEITLTNWDFFLPVGSLLREMLLDDPPNTDTTVVLVPSHGPLANHSVFTKSDVSLTTATSVCMPAV